MVQNKPESNEVDGDSIATTREEAFYWKKNLRRVKEPSNFSRTQNFGSSLPLSPLSRLIPLAHPAHVREGGCFGDEGSRDSLGRCSRQNTRSELLGRSTESIAISKCDTYEVDISSQTIYATSVLPFKRVVTSG